jgi:hypothetical protein
MHAFADAKMEKRQTEWRIMVQIGCRCPLGKQDAFLERVRGLGSREAPAGWRQQLGLWGCGADWLPVLQVPFGGLPLPRG